MRTNDKPALTRRDLLNPWKGGTERQPKEEYRRRDFFIRDEDDSPSAGAETPTPDPSADKDEPSRRDFVKTAGVVAATVAVVQQQVVRTTAPTRAQVVAAIGDVLIPSDPGDPGYKDLEAHHITEEVMKALPGVSDAEATLWNETARAKFAGRSFLELNEEQRGQYVQQIVDGTASDDPKTTERLRRMFRNTRRRIVTLYYSNFPEHQWPRDKDGMPILKPGDTHQITNPNTTTLVTGWDQARFHGPLTWEEEERRRNQMKQIHWHEGWSPFDYVPEPAAARPRKLS
jgi:hypothetical protein